MSPGTPLEITITHNLDDPAEVRELLSRHLVALDFGRDGPDPMNYRGRARTQVELFHEMRTSGAAVIAAYHGAVASRAERLVGWVEPGIGFERYNGLLCLRLSRARLVDSSRGFLGNLPPRQCTVQRCGDRAVGRLAALVLGTEVPRSVLSLHNRDVEWLVTHYLVAHGGCAATWSGTRCFETIDHMGVTSDGGEILAQTTVSSRLVKTKAASLLELGARTKHLQLFAPEAGRTLCPAGVTFIALEQVFAQVDATAAGRWLIDRMIGDDLGPT